MRESPVRTTVVICVVTEGIVEEDVKIVVTLAARRLATFIEVNIGLRKLAEGILFRFLD